MREWLVVRLNRPTDSSKPPVYTQNIELAGQPVGEELQRAERAPRPAPRNRNEQPEAGLNMDQWANIEGIGDALRGAPAKKKAGYGFFVKPAATDDYSGKIVHTDQESAEAYAQALAARNPGVLFGVFECAKVFETT